MATMNTVSNVVDIPRLNTLKRPSMSSGEGISVHWCSDCDNTKTNSILWVLTDGGIVRNVKPEDQG
eukprot:6561169-Heterocapsa_arctica.AAC.1